MVKLQPVMQMSPESSRTVRPQSPIRLILNMPVRRVSPWSILAKRTLLDVLLPMQLLIACRYHNYMQYLSNWTSNIARGIGTDDLSQRPMPVAMLYDNTTVQGRWIHVENMTSISQKYSTSNYSRIVTNVTMAMPHAGVFAASRDSINNIMQPQDLNVGCLTGGYRRSTNMITGTRRVPHTGIRSVSDYQRDLC